MDRMISLEYCRKILGPKNSVSDENLVTLREQLYCLAELALQIKDSAKIAPCGESIFERVGSNFADANVLRERAAIIEFDGNFSRDEAERLAALALASKQVN